MCSLGDIIYVIEVLPSPIVMDRLYVVYLGEGYSIYTAQPQTCGELITSSPSNLKMSRIFGSKRSIGRVSDVCGSQMLYCLASWAI